MYFTLHVSTFVFFVFVYYIQIALFTGESCQAFRKLLRQSSSSYDIYMKKFSRLDVRKALIGTRVVSHDMQNEDYIKLLKIQKIVQNRNEKVDYLQVMLKRKSKREKCRRPSRHDEILLAVSLSYVLWMTRQHIQIKKR